MACLLNVPLGAGSVGVLLVLLLGLTAVAMFRSGQPDPKMELLLSLMRDFPKEEHYGSANDEVQKPDSLGNKTAQKPRKTVHQDRRKS